MSGKYPRLWALKGANPNDVRIWYEFGALASICTVAPDFWEISELPDWVLNVFVESWHNNPHLNREGEDEGSGYPEDDRPFQEVDQTSTTPHTGKALSWAERVEAENQENDHTLEEYEATLVDASKACKGAQQKVIVTSDYNLRSKLLHRTPEIAVSSGASRAATDCVAIQRWGPD
ncbi:hypothetical protein ACS0TY_002507 [Phlomoides rotata]